MKRYFLIPSLLALCLIIISSLYFFKVKSLSETIERQLSVIEKHTKERKEYKLKEEADSLFFEGKTSEAFEKYKQLDSIFHSDVKVTRFNWLKSVDSIQANTIQHALLLKEELKNYKNKSEQLPDLLATHKLEIEKLNSEILLTKQRLQYQHDSLYSYFEKERKRILSNHQLDTLTFKSSKNHLVRFYGQTSNKKAHGLGSAMWSTGGYYFGMWKNNMRNGKGIYHWKDGEYYEGDFVNDKRQGIGKYIWSNGTKYEGSWHNDQRNGFGTLYDESGKVKFKGEWINDTPKE